MSERPIPDSVIYCCSGNFLELGIFRKGKFLKTDWKKLSDSLIGWLYARDLDFEIEGGK